MDFTNHPFLNVMWTFFMIFIWVSWFFLLIRIGVDIFRRNDIGGGKKAIWFLLVIAMPLLGALIYVISQGGGMAERDAAHMQAQRAEADAYIRDAAGTGGPAAEIERAKALLDAGAIDADEFASIKARALA